MVMEQLNRLCFIVTSRPYEIQQPNCNTEDKLVSSEKKKKKKNKKKLHCFRLRIPGFIRHLRDSITFCLLYPFPDEKNHNRRDHHQQQQLLEFQDMDGILTSDKIYQVHPRIFSYAELYIGSNGFSDEEILGSGGFGRVYRAVLPSDGTVVAVKCVANKGEQFEKTFAAELVAVAQLRHRNLVRLRGWCVHEDQLLLVYDYMPNRSLDRILFRLGDEGGNSVSLDWERRRSIVYGLAAALFYLHEQLETQIIHRDVKTSNVMLDSDYNARLGDFGLARWLEHDLEFPEPVSRASSQSPVSRTENYQFRLANTSTGGTIGYLPPESFQRRSNTTAKSDVFSFGIVVLEVASGRRAVDLTYPDEQIFLLDWVRRLSDEGKFLQAGDSRLPDGSYNLSDMQRLIHLGLLCSLNNPQSRPTMKWVMEALSCNFTSELPALPSFQAHPLYISFSSPTNTTTRSNTTSATGSSSGYVSANGNTVFLTADDESRNDSGSSDNHHRHKLTTFPSVDTPREIPFKEIIAATNNFSESQLVAEVDFATAYHGYLENHQHVIVKRLGMKTCPALRARFSDELRNIGSLRHRNLVQLRGWCTEHGEMLVVYDYLSHHSLSRLLFNHRPCDKNGWKYPVLQWRQRYNIIKSLASAILYLHEEWDEQVIHRNITSSAIFLDADMNPRLGSFALAEFLTRNAHGHHTATSSAPRGIFGYMAPEYMSSGKATTMADIYSFGVVVLEVVSGRRAVDLRWPEVLLVKKIHEFHERRRPLVELVDNRLDSHYDSRELLRLVKLGVACIHSDPESRPSMRQIISVLDGNDDCLNPVASKGGREDKWEEWESRNAASLSLIKRIQALGVH